MADEASGGVIARTTAIILALAGVAGAVSELLGKLDGLSPLISSVKEPYRYALFALLVGIGAYVLISRRRARVQAAQVPSSASDVQSGALPFAGRHKDTQNLLGYCTDYRLVFLRGASGVGKSTLIASGLASALGESSSFLLVHMRFWGDSWDDGPQRWLADALVRDMAALLPGTKLTSPNEFPAFVRQLHAQTAKRLLIVFDQFDDYQVRFRERLYLDEDSRYLSPTELLERNPFWARIAELVEDDVVRCIFVTRSDVVGALRSVRFYEPLQEMDLQRLDASAATKLVDSRLPQSAMASAERSLLVRQIVSDLDDGGVLPAQLHSACEALRQLRPLSFASYALKRLIGVQIDHLARRIAAASKVAGIETVSAHAILFALVDARPTPPKARLRTDKALLAAAHEDVAPEALDRLLNALREHDVVRPVPSEPRQWTLYHDYVASIVKELHVRADRWTVQLHAAHERMKAARGVIGRWRALLSPIDQLQVLYHRYISPEGQGRFRFRHHRPLMFWSLLRWVPYLATLCALILLAGRGALQRQSELLAARFAYGAGFPSGDEITALWDLRQAPRDVQDQFLKDMLSVPERAARFAEHGDMVVHAIVDMDVRRRDEVTRLMREQCYEPKQLPVETTQACIRISLALESDAEADWSFALNHWLGQIERGAQDADQRRLSRNTTRWLSTTSAARLMPAAAGRQLVLGASELATKPGVDLRAFQSVSMVLARAPVQADADGLLALRQAVNAAPLAGTSVRERELRRLIAIWPIAATLGERAEVDEMARSLSQLDMRSADLDAAMEDVKALHGSHNLALVLRLGKSISKLPDRQLAAWQALEQLLPRIVLDGDAKIEAERMLQAGKGPLVMVPLRPPTLDAPIDHAKQELELFKMRLNEARPSLDELGQTALASDITYLMEAFYALNLLDQQLKEQQPLTPEQVATRLYDAFAYRPEFCAFGLNLAGLLDKQELRRLKFGDGSEAQRFAKACIIGAEAIRRADASSSVPEREELSAADYVDAIVKQLEAGSEHGFEARAKEGDRYDAATARSLADRALAVLRTQPRQLRNVVRVLMIVHDNVQATDEDALIAGLVEQANQHDASDAVPAVAGLIAQLYRNQSNRVSLAGLNVLTSRFISYISDAHVTDVGTGQDLAVLAKIVESRRDGVADALATAMLSTRDRGVQQVLRQGVASLHDVMAPQALVTLLRFPTCVDQCRDELIEALNVHAKKPMTGLWQVVAWAPANKIDIRSPAWAPTVLVAALEPKLP